MSTKAPCGKTFFFNSPGMNEEWQIPQLFGFVHFCGRLNTATHYKAHIAPCMTRYQPPEGDVQKECPLNEKDAVLLGIWRTMCNTPQAWVVVWIPGSDTCIFLDRLDLSNLFFQTRYCDPTISFDVEKAKEVFYGYRKSTIRHFDPKYNLSRDTKWPAKELAKRKSMEEARNKPKKTAVVAIEETAEIENDEETGKGDDGYKPLTRSSGKGTKMPKPSATITAGKGKKQTTSKQVGLLIIVMLNLLTKYTSETGDSQGETTASDEDSSSNR